jgi:hypothetical protein
MTIGASAFDSCKQAAFRNQAAVVGDAMDLSVTFAMQFNDGKILNQVFQQHCFLLNLLPR